MTEEEKDHWIRMIHELNDKFTLDYLAGEFNVSIRTITNWKSGESRPMGMKAIFVYLFHAKHGRTFPDLGKSLPVQTTGRIVTS
jgi:hypothetical protein